MIKLQNNTNKTDRQVAKLTNRERERVRNEGGRERDGNHPHSVYEIGK